MEFKKLQENSKPTILLLSDDLTAPSGIGTQSRELVLNTIKHFNWIQLGAAVDHKAHGKRFDISEQIVKETGVEDAHVVVYPNSGYGDQGTLRRLLTEEKIDGILHFTDPRYWQWLYLMEDEIHRQWKVPIMYYAIWDNFPYPYWNIGAYSSCDLIMGISKQSHLIHQTVLNAYGVPTLEIEKSKKLPKKLSTREKVLTQYVPHGVDHHQFFPIRNCNDTAELKEFNEFKEEFYERNDCKYVVLWINRNIQRKMPSNVILAFKKFRESLPKKDRKKVCLVMHTQAVDKNGTDLPAVHRALAPECNVIFTNQKFNSKQMNQLYNIADVTLNIASNEGFGLSCLESLSAGTVVLNNVTGGLQDQMRFEDENGEWFKPTLEIPTNHTKTYEKCGEWAFPVFPRTRAIKGSIATPYIFDDISDFEEVAEQLKNIYDMSKKERDSRGIAGHEWVHGEESMMSVKYLGENIAFGIQTCLDAFEEKSGFEIVKSESPDFSENAILYTN